MSNGLAYMTAERFRQVSEGLEDLQNRNQALRQELSTRIAQVEVLHSNTMKAYDSEIEETGDQVEQGAVLLKRIMKRGELIKLKNIDDTNFKTILAFYKASLIETDKVSSAFGKIKRTVPALVICDMLRNIEMTCNVAHLLYECATYYAMLTERMMHLVSTQNRLAID